MKTGKRFLAGIFCLLMVVICVVGLTSCESKCDHKWSDWKATAETSCTEPTEKQRTCSLCDEVEKKTFDAEGHKWKSATCESAKTCTVCKATEGEALGHTWTDATCEAAKTCSVCKKTEGEALGHTWVDATCEVAKTCSTCKATEGDALGHKWLDATCDDPKTCEVCKDTKGEARGHSYTYVSNGDGTHTKTCANDATHTAVENCTGGTATCTDKAVCDHCKTGYGEEPDHDWGTGTPITGAGCLTGGTMQYTCSKCQNTKTETIGASGHSYVDTVTDPTCTEQGYTTHVCSKCSDTYVDSYVGADGHSWDREKDCENGRECTACHVKEDALGHNYSELTDKATAATCTAAATKTYKCDRCQHEYTEDVGAPNGHDITGVEPVESLKEGSTCEYIKYYKCKNCNENVEGEHIHRHNYVASISKAATCKEDGEKTLKCTLCADTKTEVVKKNETAHDYEQGAVADGKRTDTCKHCGATKLVTVYEGTSTGSTNANNFKDTEIELNNANIALDAGVIDKIGDKNVTLSADKVGASDLEGKVPADKLAQVGDSPIYNFTINDGEKNISTFGDDNWVTITLPYTLSEGEDVDSIAIWFIDDEGNLESIKATYNEGATPGEGYVTFKTNHFSYYTVTKLTPKERCELYGHNYTKTTVEGTCTSDGYTLEVCVRCHDTVKTITSVAEGHKHVAETTEATCTQSGKTVYTCSACGHSYTIRIAATGHNWTLKEHLDASCTAAGYDKYSCDKCGGEYSEDYAQLDHKITDTVVAPTCDDYGYTEHKCDNCDYSYTDTVVSAKGHDYAASWSWADDYSTATLTLTCKADATHVVTQAAEITEIKTEPTCTAKGKIEYRATAVVNGAAYKDSKSAEVDKLDHTYSEEFEFDAGKHWHECKCGAKSEAVAHQYDDGTVTKNPTCSDAGEAEYKCECGYTKKSTVPATGEHTYVGGKCTACGKIENVCDHTKLDYKIIDLADFGCCGGKIVILTCECGEVVEVDDIDSFGNIDCDLSDYEETEEEDEENGIWTATMSGKCPDCGLEVFAKATEIEKDCLEKYAIEYEFKKDGNVILYFTMEEEEEYHDDERVSVDLTEYGACGGTVSLYVCEDCGKVTNYSGADYGCEGTEKTEEITDENGNVHEVTTYECAKCGLKSVIEVWEEKINECETIYHGICKITVGDKVIADIEIAETDDDHEYEIEYEYLGEGCEDGYKVKYVCKTCGDTEETVRVGHRFYTHGQQPIHESITCGGYIYASKCDVCGVIGNVSQMNPGCDMSNTEQSTTTDENGVEHTIMKATCSKCGTKYEGDMWVEVRSVCESVTHMEYLVTDKDGNVIYDFEMTDYDSDHEYEHDYQLKGESCDDGYTVTQNCPKCGDSYSWNGSGHRTEYEELSIADMGGCGGYINAQVCEICETATYFYNNTYCRIYNGQQKVEEFVGDDGLTHTVTTSTCLNCSLIYIEETWQTAEVECRYTQYRNLCIKKGEEVLFDVTRKDNNSNHNYTYEYELKGESCDDGYTVSESCDKCGYTNSWNSDGHRTEGQEISLGDYTPCGGYLRVDSCQICNQTTYFHENSWCKWEYMGTTDDGYEKEVCRNPECGAVRLYKYARSEKNDNCTVIYSQEYKYFVGGECVLEFNVEERNKEHNFDYTFRLQGESCEDGVQINCVCRDCGHTETWGTQWHSLYDKEEIILSEHGACGGTISVRECPCGERKEISVNYDGCQMEYVSEEKTDNGYASVYRCATCGLTVTRENGTEKEGCILYWYEAVAVTIGDKVVFGPEKYVTSSDTSHDYEYTYVLQGETCKEGVIVTMTCKDCGENHEEQRYWCDSQTIAEYSFGEYGSCGGGYIRVYSCPCGAQAGVEYEHGCAYEEMYGSYVDDNGVNHEVWTSTCPSCGLKIVRDSYGEKNGCETVYYSTFTVTVGDKTVVEGLKAATGKGYNHTYETNFELKGESCEDGVTVYRTCTYCGKSSSYEISYHESFLVEEYNFADHGACTTKGFLRVYSCACGDNYRVEYSRGCAGYQGEETVVDDNGVEHIIATYYCKKCGLQIITDTYSVKDGCYRYEYRTYTITVGDTVVVEDFECLYNKYDEHDYEHSFELKGKSCEDGVIVSKVCRACGYTATEEYSWHREYTLQTHNYSENGCCSAKINVNGCLCGDYCSVDWDMNCKQKNSSYVDDNGVVHLVYTYTCGECGILLTRDRYTVTEGCYEITYIVYNMTKGDEVLLDDVKTIYDRNFNHDYEYSFDMIGKSCEEGYYVTKTCRACGEVENFYNSWHEIYLIEKHELSEHGVCGKGVIEIYGCPCGQEVKVDIYGLDCNLNKDEGVEYTDENGVFHKINTSTCETCGLVISTDAYKIKENCQAVIYSVYTLQVGDNVIIDGVETIVSRYEDHNLEETVQMNGESCMDGVRIDHVCLDCGYSYYDEYWDHWTYEKENIDLGAHGACYGKIIVYECLCGECKEIETSYCSYHYTNNEYVDEKGIRHYVEVATCDACGLRVQRDRYTVRDSKTCTSVTYESIAVSIGDKAVTVLENTYKETDSHDYEYTATLADGAEQCGQGTIVTWTCRDCGYSNSYTYYYHYMVTLNKIDLAEFGATCGGYADERGCACGYEHELDLHDHTDCEFEGRYNGNVDVEGSVGNWNSYIYTCAVTDPACGFKVKYMSYYLVEEGSCIAYNYHTWLFGYNEETGEYKYELTFKRNASYETHHTYETFEINETYEGGIVKGTKRVCSVCGTYTTTKNYYDSKERRVKFEQISEYFHEKADPVYYEDVEEYTYYTNKDGKENSYTSRDYEAYRYQSGRFDWRDYLYEYDYNYAVPFGEYGVLLKEDYKSSNSYDNNQHREIAYAVYKGCEFTIYEYVVSNPNTDSEYWSRTEYTYDPEILCNVTYVYTDIYGKTEEGTDVHHRATTYVYEGGSCTQDRIRTETCVICEQVISTEERNPYNHNWYYNYETGIYECSRCGLENANGASGSIVMEDMSDKYGEDVNYVVGYWNREKVKYTYYVSLVLKDVEADEVFVEVECTETEGLRAYSISKEAVAKAAEALGYTADQYDVKFTFVPEGADGSYDYAIVFTSETVAE